MSPLPLFPLPPSTPGLAYDRLRDRYVMTVPCNNVSAFGHAEYLYEFDLATHEWYMICHWCKQRVGSTTAHVDCDALEALAQ